MCMVLRPADAHPNVANSSQSLSNSPFHGASLGHILSVALSVELPAIYSRHVAQIIALSAPD